MSLLADVIAAVSMVESVEPLARIEVTQAQYDRLKSQAYAETPMFPVGYPQSSSLMGVPVIIVEEDMPLPALVYASGRRVS